MTTAQNDKLTEAHEQMVQAVESLVSGDDWAQMLAVASRFHHYSFGNVCLILSQRSDATKVCGYQMWVALGRQVRRGERGIAILAPWVSRGRPVEDSDDTEHPEVARVLRGFHVVHVFDIAQTDGPDLPEVAPNPLQGTAPDVLWDRLAEQVVASGFALVREDCSPANGQTDFLRRTVAVRPDLSDAQAVKTLAHEIGHVLLHDDEKFRGLTGQSCRGLAEVEAESVAYLVCSSAGLGTDQYTFPYVARWADGDVALVRSAAERSLGAARTITTAIGLTAEPDDPATEAVVARSAGRSGDRSDKARSHAPKPPSRRREIAR